MLRKARQKQHNRKAKQHKYNAPKTVIFQGKLAASGGTQTHDHWLSGDALTNCYQGSSVGGLESCIQITKHLNEHGGNNLTLTVKEYLLQPSLNGHSIPSPLVSQTSLSPVEINFTNPLCASDKNPDLHGMSVCVGMQPKWYWGRGLFSDLEPVLDFSWPKVVWKWGRLHLFFQPVVNNHSRDAEKGKATTTQQKAKQHNTTVETVIFK